MGLIMHGGIAYGGGSDVVANPQDSATDTLTKVGIDGTVYEVTDADAVHTSDIGTANGVAELDANGLVPSSQLPSYVDDVLEYASVSAFPATGETGKIYVALDTNLTYRWSGSAYVEISPSLALGETSSTAYRGDRGKTAYDHATESGRSGAKSAGLYKIGVTAQGHVASTSAVAKADLTALGVADQNDVDAIEADIEGYNTVTGKYITVTDAASLPAESYSLTLSPVQEGSGDPSPSNVRPIHGADEVGVRVCGVNLWDEEWEVGGISAGSINSKNYISVVPSQVYYAKYNGSISNVTTLYVNYYDGEKNLISQANSVYFGANFTIPANARFMKFRAQTQYGTTYNHDISINYPSTDHDYHAYNGHSTTITLPSTVYGGSVDLTTGVLTVTAIKKYISDLTWTYRTISGVSGYVFLSNDVSEVALGKSPLYSTCYNIKTSRNYIDGDSQIAVSNNTNAKDFVVKDDKFDNLSDFINERGGEALIFELETPQTIQLTPFPQTLLEGVNNVWAEMVENSTVIDNAQQSLSYQPQNIVGQLRQEIEAKPDSFAQLSDTSFSNLTNGQIPKWNSTSGKWENANESGGGGASSLAELSDTTISSPADGQILKWDGTTSKWVNAAEYSYTLPTASASTKGGVKVGDNLAMNGEVLSAKLPQWEKIWNYNSGATFSMPTDKTDIMLVIKVTLLVASRIMSNVYPVEYPFSASLVCSYELDDTVLGSGTLAINVSTANTVTITNTSQWTSQNVDFEIWVR